MIEQIIEDYYKAWNNALATNDSSQVREKMSPEFVGYWCHSALAAPQKYDYDYDLNDVLEQYLGTQTTKSFEIESITTRTNDVLVFGTETNTVNGIDYPAKIFFVWKNEQDGWRLLREYIELIN